jgi:hypothetical protein
MPPGQRKKKVRQREGLTGSSCSACVKPLGFWMEGRSSELVAGKGVGNGKSISCRVQVFHWKIPELGVDMF